MADVPARRTDRTPDGTGHGPGGGELHDLIAAYALDAVDELERARVERHLDGCADCREELAGFRSVTDHLAAGPDEAPPPDLRERVLAGLGPQEPATPGTPTTAATAATAVRSDGGHGGGRGAARPDGRRTFLAVAAGLLVLGVLAGSVVLTRATPLERVEQLAAQGRVEEVAGLVGSTAQLRAYTPPDDPGFVVEVVTDGEEAVLVTGGLDALPADRTYQAWVLQDGTASSAGVLGPGADPAAAIEDWESADAVALSVEPEGGSATPTEDGILVAVPLG